MLRLRIVHRARTCQPIRSRR